MRSQYADFARDYDWLFSDFQQVGERHVRDVATRLETVESPRILDCACGTGLLALALARHGYEVVGTDASPEMVEQAAARAARDEISLTLSACEWADLPRRFGPEFDFVLCCGNSIGHCRDETEMIKALAAMRAVIRPGGWLLLDSRNWETLLSERVRFTSFGLRERDGKRCIPLYVWNFPEDPADRVTVEVVFPFESAGEVTLRSYAIAYQPFTSLQLANRMSEAGFIDVEVEPVGTGFLHVAGKVPPTSPLADRSG